MESNKVKNPLIIYDSIGFFIPHFERKGFKVYRLYKSLPFLLKIVKRIFSLLNINLAYWYSDWTKEIENYDTLILFATKDNYCLKFIKQINPSMKVIFWYWNPAMIMAPPGNIKRDLCEMWSFDPRDCLEFGMRFNTTFYFNTIRLSLKPIIEFDLLFLGIDKGRKEYLDNLENSILELGLKPYFHIVPNKGEEGATSPKPIPYEKYLELLSSSRAIVDLTPINQSGLTLRPMESIFFKKKLITNDKSIMNMDFYHPQNIFILKGNNLTGLKEFIESDYFEIDDSIIQKYDVASWVNRFLNH